MDIFAVIPNQSFATRIGERFTLLSARLIFTQGTNEPLRVYLMGLSPHPGSAYPLAYDPRSGDVDVRATVSLTNPGGSPFTLATAELVAIPNGKGFSCELNTATAEIETFLTGLADRECALSIDLADADGGNPTSPFQGRVLLRAAAAGLPVTPVGGISGNSPDLIVSAAGTSDLVPTHVFTQWYQRVTANAGAGAYTHKLTLDNGLARDGSIYRVRIDIPASANPVIEIYDDTVAGALLETVRGDSDNATSYLFEAEYDSETAAWRKLNGDYL